MDRDPDDSEREHSRSYKPKSTSKHQKIPQEQLLRKPIYPARRDVQRLAGAYEILETIEQDARVHRHEHDYYSVDEQEDEHRQYDDEQTILNDEGHELKEYQHEFKEKNPGCWIFGHGVVHNLPPEFSNPVHVAQFAKKVATLMIFCLISRTILLSLAIFVPVIHHALFVAELFAYPLIGSIFLFVLITVLLHVPYLEKYTQLSPLNVLIFLITEITFTFTMLCISLGSERVAQHFVISLDLYQEYRTVNVSSDGTGKAVFPPSLPENFEDHHITPAFFFIASHIQVIVNLSVFIVLTIYTKYWLGSRVTYRLVTGFTIASTIILFILLFDYSYGIVEMYDRLQLVATIIWTILTNYLFIHYIERVMEGKILKLYGMRWNDVCNAGLRVCFV